VFIDLQACMKLALYPRKEIAWDARLPAPERSDAARVSLFKRKMRFSI